MARLRVLGEGLGQPGGVLGLEARVPHAQGAEKPFLQKLRQAPPRQSLQEVAEEVGGEAVLKGLPGLEAQRQRGEALQKDLPAQVKPVHPGLEVKPLHRGAEEDPVGEPRGVAEEVVDGEGALQGLVDDPLPHLPPHPEPGKLRQVLLHGVQEGEGPLLHEAQGQGGDPGLGHGVEAEEGVLPHGKPPPRVQVPVDPLEDHLPTPGHEDHGPGEEALLHQAPEVGVKPP